MRKRLAEENGHGAKTTILHLLLKKEMANKNLKALIVVVGIQISNVDIYYGWVRGSHAIAAH